MTMAARQRNLRPTGSSRFSAEPLVATYQTRLHDYKDVDQTAGHAALSDYADLYGRVRRKLFAQVAAGGSAASLKRRYRKGYGIPARMFSGVRVSLEGKVASVKERQKLRFDSLSRRIARADRQIADASGRGRWDRVHQKRRRLANLQRQLKILEADVAADRVRLCFGSKRLWRKQRDLGANGYTSQVNPAFSSVIGRVKFR
ncbi:MAG: hypothetical protein F4W95_07390 [Chloroflexi bacterium]|nr:hypothetical protein [Chloroflexota bacterium]MYD48294.1 hypothetical protein [Chloroflexota bacterium]